MLSRSLMKRESLEDQEVSLEGAEGVKRLSLGHKVLEGSSMELEDDGENALVEAYLQNLDAINQREISSWQKEYTLGCRYNRIMRAEIESLELN